MKVTSPLAGFIGAIPGAMPFMLGWVALQGHFGLETGVFFAIQFVWQFPHFWSIAWIRFEDYKKANINLLPSKKKDNKSAFQIVFYTFCLIPLSLSPLFLPYIYPESLLRLSLVGSFVVFLMSGWYFLKTLRFLKKSFPKNPSKDPVNNIIPSLYLIKSSILQFGSSSFLISKKDLEESLTKFLYPSKFLANNGIFPIWPLCKILICVPIIG